RLRGDAATLVAALDREWRLHLRRADVAGAVGNAQPRLPARARRLQGERGGGRLAHRDFLPGPAGLADFQAQRRDVEVLVADDPLEPDLAILDRPGAQLDRWRDRVDVNPQRRRFAGQAGRVERVVWFCDGRQ